MRLARNGNSYRGYLSADGGAWTPLGQYSVSMAAQAYVGLAVTSHADGVLSSAAFDHVAITTVRIGPTSATLAIGATLQFHATAADTTPVAVDWQLSGPGTLGASGLYTAPAALTLSPTTASVTAVATQDGSALATAVITITDPAAVTLTPRRSALAVAQSQQYAAAVPGGGSVLWSVDGVAGGNGNVGTISSAGLYLAPAGAATHTVTATSAADPARFAAAAVAVTDLPGIYSYHYDLARTGQNLQEYALTPASIAGGGFGRRWTCPVDGEVYAQPLFVAQVPIAGGSHNLLLVVTQHDSVYAFDADSPDCASYWHTSFIGAGRSPVPVADTGCSDILGEYGITGTPVIDPASRTLYLVAKTKEGGSYFQRLHALDLSSGAERASSPVAIAASVATIGGGAASFSPLWQNQRPGLVLSDGGVYIG